MSLIEPSPPPHRTFSEVLEDLGVADEPTLAMSEVVEAFGDRGLGALILVFSLMALFPWPPGGKAVFAIPIILLSIELSAQRNEVWLPRWALKASLSRTVYARLITTPFSAPGWLRRWVLTRRIRVGFGQSASVYVFAPWVRRAVRRRPKGLNFIRLLRAVENLTRPRLALFTGPITEIVIGILCVLLAVIMALPVPLGDMLPGLALIFLALGVMQKDGVSVLIGAFFSVVTGGYLLLVWRTVVEIGEHIVGWALRILG